MHMDVPAPPRHVVDAAHAAAFSEPVLCDLFWVCRAATTWLPANGIVVQVGYVNYARLFYFCNTHDQMSWTSVFTIYYVVESYQCFVIEQKDGQKKRGRQAGNKEN